MINQQTLQTLLAEASIKKVNNECADIGLSHIRLFVTNEFEDKDKIHFLGKSEQKGISLFLIQQIEDELAQFLKCEIVIATEDMLNEIIKEEILKNTADYTSENVEGIKSFFESQILPRAEWNFFEDTESFEEEEKEALANELLETLSQQHPELLSKVQNCPDVLVTVKVKLVQQREATIK